MKKTINEVFAFVEDFLGRKLTPKNKADIAEMLASMQSEIGPPPTGDPPGGPPKP